MINMDDPRHARLRRIVSRSFTPRMIRRFEDDARQVAAAIIDDLLKTGPCDFVEHVAARLPLSIICRMMGIPDSNYHMVLRNSRAREIWWFAAQEPRQGGPQSPCTPMPVWSHRYSPVRPSVHGGERL